MHLRLYKSGTDEAEDDLTSSGQSGPASQMSHLEALFRSAPVGLCFIDLEFRFREANDYLARLFNVPLEHFQGRTVEEVLGSSSESVIGQLRISLETKKPVQIDLSLLKQKGWEWSDCVFSAEPLIGAFDEVSGFSVAFLEAPQQTFVEETVREDEEHLRVAVGLTNQVLWTANAHGDVVDIDETWAQLTGCDRSQALGEGWAQILHPDDEPTARERWKSAVFGSDRYEDVYRVAFADREWRWVLARAIPRLDSDGNVQVWYGTLEDIHERKQMEEALSMKTEWLEDATQQISSLAQEDHLTGLANRRRLDSVLKDEVKRAGRSEKGIALIMLDVDHFKLFNDRLGHIAGDGCLRSVATALKGVLHRPGDFVARFGGEEFVILLPNTDKSGALKVAEHAVAAVKDLQIKHPASPCGVVTISAGVGVLDVANSIPANEQVLLERADAALYAAKSAGRNRVAGSIQLR